MSISAEQAEKLKNGVAVVCCRTEAGTMITPEHLEDPTIFPDLEDSGLLSIPDNCAKIGQVIGAKVIKTIDSLTPLTPDILEGMKEMELSNEEVKEKTIKDLDEKAVFKSNMKTGDVIKIIDLENPMNFHKLEDSLLISLDDKVLTRFEVMGAKLTKDVPALTPVTPDMLEGFNPVMEETSTPQNITSASYGGVLRIKIAEGKGIDIEVPLGGYLPQEVMAINPPSQKEEKPQIIIKETPVKVLRKLVKKHYQIDEVKFGPETKIEGTTLYIRETHRQRP